MSGEIWLASTDEETWYTPDEFPTKQEAIDFGRAEFEGERFWVGRKADYVPALCGDHLAESVIEQLGLDAYDVVGEAADEWPDASKDEVAALGEELVRTVGEWLKNHPPSFFRIVDVEEIEAAEQPEPAP